MSRRAARRRTPARPRLSTVLAVPALAFLSLAACGVPEAAAPPWAGGADGAGPAERYVPPTEMAFEVPPPPFRDPEIFPCTECHNADLPPNPERRKLDMAHDDIVLSHDEEHRWCLDCHDAANRDRLRMANGTLVPFEESYRLCGQCHGDKYRDWRAGVHGRRTGRWDGDKQYLLCVNCHDSHAPRFKPMKPYPPPVRPGSLR